MSTPSERYIALVGDPTVQISVRDDVEGVAAIVKAQLRAAEFHASELNTRLEGVGQNELLLTSIIALVAAAHDEIAALEQRAVACRSGD